MLSRILSVEIKMSKNLKELLEEPFVDGERIKLSNEVKTAGQSAERLGVDKNHIIKSLVFLIDEIPYLVIVPGSRRADTDKIKQCMEAETVVIAPRERVKPITGYKPGTVPPIGTGLTSIIEESILDNEAVYGGGGARNTMLKINPRCIVGENDVVDHII